MSDAVPAWAYEKGEAYTDAKAEFVADALRRAAKFADGNVPPAPRALHCQCRSA